MIAVESHNISQVYPIIISPPQSFHESGSKKIQEKKDLDPFSRYSYKNSFSGKRISSQNILPKYKTSFHVYKSVVPAFFKALFEVLK